MKRTFTLCHAERLRLAAGDIGQALRYKGQARPNRHFLCEKTSIVGCRRQGMIRDHGA